MKKISFVTTIYRTAEHIEPFAEGAAQAAALLGFDHEVIFVNDGSPDHGLEVAKSLSKLNPHVVVVDLTRNYGQHKALWTGLKIAKGDLVAMLDGDMEENPLWIADFYRTMIAEGADVVYGVQPQPKGNAFYRFSRNAFYRMLNFISDLDFPADVATVRLMNRPYVDALLTFEEREIWLTGIMHVAGFKQVAAPVLKLATSPTKYTFYKLFRLFLMAVTAFSITPLIGVFLAGVVISALAFLYIFVLIVLYFTAGVGVAGWTSVMAALFLFSGILTLFNGLIAIYVGTIFIEVKRRPMTIIRSISGQDSEKAEPRS